MLSSETSRTGSDADGKAPVVIITQSPVNRVVLAGVLSRLGYRIVSADFSYADFDNDNPSALVIDCTGERAACAPLFGRLAGTSRPKVLMISGGERDPMAPVDHYVEKPMTTDKLEVAIHRLFGN
ncbi:MAG: hypothetical protein KDJ73_04770 [Notoacmeibacter sp.]|nr:hypothetical protein [Notoacmeibacter sp.]MCC0032505.1 hypothetical protein [Brucellaceae bacterium]